MSDHARQVLEQALRLPAEDRSTVVAEMLASLDGAADADVDGAWAEELARRARRARNGESRPISRRDRQGDRAHRGTSGATANAQERDRRHPRPIE